MREIECVKELIEEWDAKQGHDQCHYYPEIFLLIAGVVGAKLTREHKLPPRHEFRAGCRQFEDEAYKVASDDTWIDHLLEDLNKIARRTLGGSFPASAKRDIRDAIKKSLNIGD